MSDLYIELTAILIFFLCAILVIILSVYESFFIKKQVKTIKHLFSKIETDDAQVKVILWYPTGDLFNRMIFMNKVSASLCRKNLRKKIDEAFPVDLVKKIRKLAMITRTLGVIAIISAAVAYFL